MGQSKHQWIEETGGFRIGESAEVSLARRRMAELAQKIKDRCASVEERGEYVRLVESLPDEENPEGF